MVLFSYESCVCVALVVLVLGMGWHGLGWAFGGLCKASVVSRHVCKKVCSIYALENASLTGKIETLSLTSVAHEIVFMTALGVGVFSGDSRAVLCTPIAYDWPR